VTTLEVVAVTHRGRVRDQNEDTVAAGGFLSGAFEGEPVRLALASEQPIACLVADGLGGHAEGARASRLVAAHLADAWSRFGDPASAAAAVQDAHAALYEEMRAAPSASGMGATLAGIVFTGDRAICVNVGDSRCFRISDGMLAQVSIDDSLPPRDDGLTPPTHLVTQTLGGSDRPTTVEPHIFCDVARVGDRYLLCSDGLTDYVDLDVLEGHLAGTDDPVTTVRAMLASALAAGAPDNVSVVLVRVAGSAPRHTEGEKI
jgi:serine/threonine protein phosphatase PrpC